MSQKRVAHVLFHGLAAGGDAVGRDEQGKTVFAPFGAPGEVAWVEIDQEKASFARGLIQNLESASAARIAPLCPQFRPQTPHVSCGGCAWQHLDVSAQRSAKRDIVAAALSRLGGQKVEVEPCRGGDGFNYRNKADFVVERLPLAAPDTTNDGAQIGFFAHGTHDLVPARVCPIQNAGNGQVLEAARQILRQNPQFAFDPSTENGPWRRLVARTSSDGDTLVTLISPRKKWAEAEEVARQLRAALPRLRGVLLRGPHGDAKAIWGRDFLTEAANGLSFRVTGDAFWQVNPEISPQLAQTALELAQIEGGQRALDLFCGAGLFALHLARAGAQVTGIEAHPGAVRDAVFNAGQNNLKARFIAADAARELRRFKRGDFEVVLLDPPRAGAAPCLEPLLDIQAKRVVYVSCDPATLARDAKILCDGGYVLRRAIPFDLFPQTAHVETVALFEKIL